MSAIDRLWAQARDEISSISPESAADLQSRGALMVDTRPEAQRRQFGGIPGAVTVERNVLEWRLDPTCPHHHELVSDPGQTIVVFCQEGYSSVLAVASLGRLGLSDVHDLSGGFEAWAAAGLPTSGGEGPT
jgi:rhodanese-related sulfurtransferase